MVVISTAEIDSLANVNVAYESPNLQTKQHASKSPMQHKIECNDHNVATYLRLTTIFERSWKHYMELCLVAKSNCVPHPKLNNGVVDSVTYWNGSPGRLG